MCCTGWEISPAEAASPFMKRERRGCGPVPAAPSLQCHPKTAYICGVIPAMPLCMTPGWYTVPALSSMQYRPWSAHPKLPMPAVPSLKWRRCNLRPWLTHYPCSAIAPRQWRPQTVRPMAVSKSLKRRLHGVFALASLSQMPFCVHTPTRTCRAQSHVLALIL